MMRGMMSEPGLSAAWPPRCEARWMGGWDAAWASGNGSMGAWVRDGMSGSNGRRPDARRSIPATSIARRSGRRRRKRSRSGKARSLFDPYFNIVQVTVYGQARFYNAAAGRGRGTASPGDVPADPGRARRRGRGRPGGRRRRPPGTAPAPAEKAAPPPGPGDRPRSRCAKPAAGPTPRPPPSRAGQARDQAEPAKPGRCRQGGRPPRPSRPRPCQGGGRQEVAGRACVRGGRPRRRGDRRRTIDQRRRSEIRGRFPSGRDEEMPYGQCQRNRRENGGIGTAARREGRRGDRHDGLPLLRRPGRVQAHDRHVARPGEEGRAGGRTATSAAARIATPIIKKLGRPGEHQADRFRRQGRGADQGQDRRRRVQAQARLGHARARRRPDPRHAQADRADRALRLSRPRRLAGLRPR